MCSPCHLSQTVGYDVGLRQYFYAIATKTPGIYETGFLFTCIPGGNTVLHESQ